MTARPAQLYVTCEYCGHRGVFREEIELRQPKSRDGVVFACIDTSACDARDSERSGDEDGR